MTMQVSRIAKHARKGAIKAALKYEKISKEGNLWDRGIETYISSTIAELIYAKEGNPVELEYAYSSLLEDLGVEYDGKNNQKLNLSSRFDIVDFRKSSGRPLGIIEVKKRFAEFNLMKDRERLLDAIYNGYSENKSGLKFGISVALDMVRVNSGKDAEQKADEALKQLKEHKEIFNAEIDYSSKVGPFGNSKKGTEIIGLNAFSITYWL